MKEPAGARLIHLLLAVVLGCALMAASSCGSAGQSGRSRDTAPASGTTPGRQGGPPPIPSSGAYVGAWVNPGGESGLQGELRQLPGFEQATGRVPAIVSVYTAFAAPPAPASLNAIADLGAVPLISWECRSVADVASGAYDGTVSAYAKALRDFGRPVFLRWFWEMNLHDSTSERCLNGSGAAGFVAAWIRIRSLFASAGADNVAFVWCPGVGPGTPPSSGYFPGARYVDWIGADGYDRRGEGAAAVTTVFAGWYTQYQPYGRPMMIAEAGAMARAQVAFLAGVAAQLPSLYPNIKAFVYFDARGPAASWTLTGAGLPALGELERNPYFAYRAPW